MAFVLGTLVYITIYSQWNTPRVRQGLFILTSFAMIACAILNYDHRDDQQKDKEKAMNQFVKAPPFPYISNRDKILYSATEFGEVILEFEYSGENKPAFRNGGNRQTGIQETALAA